MDSADSLPERFWIVIDRILNGGPLLQVAATLGLLVGIFNVVSSAFPELAATTWEASGE